MSCCYFPWRTTPSAWPFGRPTMTPVWTERLTKFALHALWQGRDRWEYDDLKGPDVWFEVVP